MYLIVLYSLLHQTNYLAYAKIFDFYFDYRTIDFAIAKINSTIDTTIVTTV